jgi:hypothetical protein
VASLDLIALAELTPMSVPSRLQSTTKSQFAVSFAFPPGEDRDSLFGQHFLILGITIVHLSVLSKSKLGALDRARRQNRRMSRHSPDSG